MMPFGMSLGGNAQGLFQGHHPGGGALQRGQQQHGKHIKRLAVAAAAATASVGLTQLHRQGKLPLLPLRPAPGATKQQKQQLLRIPRELAEVICGAVGEIVQVAVLYPLDTIKVRCQAGGLPFGAVVQQLLSSSPNPAGVVRQLYAGVVSASLASVAVGSLYYFTFCAAKRTATRMVADSERQSGHTTAAAAAAAVAAGGSISNSSSSSSTGSHHHFPHSAGVDCHGFDPVFAAICSDDKAAAAAAARAQRAQQPDRTTTTSAGGSSTTTTTTSSGSAAAAVPASELSSGGKLQANIMAAAAAAVVGALVEAPVELFKHRAQAGQIQGAMLAHVAAALRQSGPAALYGSFFVPFLFKSLPFDIGELMTYSCLNDWRAAQQKQQQAARGAGAGAAAAGAAAAVPAPAPGVLFAPEAAAQDTGALSPQQQQQQQQQQHMLALGSLTATSLAGSGSGSSSGSGGSSGFNLLQPGQVVQQMPEHVWDMAVGATAGAAAVLISMPPDCIKTVMETGGGVTSAPCGRPLHSAAAFAATGRRLVGQHGPRGLFMGLTPRLVESVPSTMLYWLAVEGCRRLLEPHVAPDAGPAATGGSSSS